MKAYIAVKLTYYIVAGVAIYLVSVFIADTVKIIIYG